MALDSLSALLGLVLLAAPFAQHAFPGDIDTTVHVTLGTLLTTLAAFRALLAYGGLWLEALLFIGGILTFLMPRIMHMQWHHPYNSAHLAIGTAIMLLSLLSAALTVPQLRKNPA
jgi:cytochrome b561